MDKKQKSSPRNRPASTGGKSGREAEPTPEAGAAPGVEAGGDELLGQFVAIAVRLQEEIDRRVEEKLRENADLKFDFDFDRETRELKQYNAELRKIISGFERLKKANNERLEDLKWLRDEFDPTGPGFHVM